MANLIFVIHKEKKWIIESKKGSKLEKSEHSSRIKAMNRFFAKHPELVLFYIIIPDKEAKDVETGSLP